MRWYDVPMTWADGVRLMLLIFVINAIAHGPVIPAFIAGFRGQ